MSLWQFTATTNGYLKSKGGDGQKSKAPSEEDFNRMVEQFG